MGCAPCAKKRAMAAAGLINKYQVVHSDGTTAVFDTIRDAQRNAAKNPGSAMKVIQEPKVPAVP